MGVDFLALSWGAVFGKGESTKGMGPWRFGWLGSRLRESVGALTGQAASVLSDPDQSCWIAGVGLATGLCLGCSLFVWGGGSWCSLQWGPWAGRLGPDAEGVVSLGGAQSASFPRPNLLPLTATSLGDWGVVVGWQPARRLRGGTCLAVAPLP